MKDFLKTMINLLIEGKVKLLQMPARFNFKPKLILTLTVQCFQILEISYIFRKKELYVYKKPFAACSHLSFPLPKKTKQNHHHDWANNAISDL